MQNKLFPATSTVTTGSLATIALSVWHWDMLLTRCEATGYQYGEREATIKILRTAAQVYDVN